jgi:ribose/xylose/arabinose/galactoside ABC-type transport system permease subunit
VPDQLTVAARSRPDAPTRRSPLLALALQALAVVAVLVVAGLLAAVVWFQLWSPATGTVRDGRWFTDEDGLRGAFSGTGLFVLVAALTGFLVGAMTAFLFDRAELLTLVATLVGAALGGWLMLRLGLSWSPADPVELARTAADGTKLDSELTVDLPYAWLTLPCGALIGTAVVFLVTTKRPEADAAGTAPSD